MSFVISQRLALIAVSARSQRSVALTPNPRGVPEGGRAPRHIPRDDTAGPDCGVVTYGDARQNNSAPANPDIAADRNRPAKLRARQSHHGIAWMIGRVYLNRGSDVCSCADAHRHHVENHTIEIQKNIGAERDVVAIVAMERRGGHPPAGADRPTAPAALRGALP